MSEENSNDLDARIAGFDPTDPAALAALESELVGGEATNATDEPTPVDVAAGEKTVEPAKQDEKKAEQVAEPAPAAKPEGAPSGVQEPEGVQAKDGKHVIPYSVLERERDRATRAESTAAALAEEIDRLKAGKPAESAQVTISEEDLAQLDNDLPSVAKAIRAQMALINSLNGTVNQLQREQGVVAQNQQRSIDDEIEAAISGNHDLSAWRNEAFREETPNPLMWNRAVSLDKALREDPEWQNKTFAERFAQVAETMKSLYGAPAAEVTPARSQQPTQAELKQAADAKLKETPAPVPTSLSDIPGGNPPAQSHLESLENASAVALGNRFLSMSPDQMESELARLGI